MRKQVRHRGREAGFTLIELMVALTAGLITIVSIYYLSASATRHFHEQQRIAQTQMSVRIALEQLRRDIARAGFGGTPDSDLEGLCFSSPNRLRAIEYSAGADTAQLQNAAENGVGADRLRLVGNYTAPDTFLAVGLSADGQTVFLQRDWQSFRRTFTDSVTGAFSEDAFISVFPLGRMLQIQAVTGERYFVSIESVDPALASIRLSDALPVGTPCVPGLLAGAMVSPLSRIEWITRYALSGTTLEPGANAADLGLTSPQLVRQEIVFEDVGLVATVLDNNERIVLENVADVSFGFVVDQSAAGDNAPVLERVVDPVAAQTILDDSPARVRAIVASITSHTPEQDPRFPFVAGQGRFRVNPALPGAARVRTAVAEILVPNVAYRNLP